MCSVAELFNRGKTDLLKHVRQMSKDILSCIAGVVERASPTRVGKKTLKPSAEKKDLHPRLRAIPSSFLVSNSIPTAKPPKPSKPFTKPLLTNINTSSDNTGPDSSRGGATIGTPTANQPLAKKKRKKKGISTGEVKRRKSTSFGSTTSSVLPSPSTVRALAATTISSDASKLLEDELTALTSQQAANEREGASLKERVAATSRKLETRRRLEKELERERITFEKWSLETARLARSVALLEGELNMVPSIQLWRWLVLFLLLHILRVFF